MRKAYEICQLTEIVKLPNIYSTSQWNYSTFHITMQAFFEKMQNFFHGISIAGQCPTFFPKVILDNGTKIRYNNCSERKRSIRLLQENRSVRFAWMPPMTATRILLGIIYDGSFGMTGIVCAGCGVSYVFLCLRFEFFDLTRRSFIPKWFG